MRAVDLATGQVTTFCGKVKEPGFLAQGILPEQPGPCLRQPRGILALGPFLFVADAGNNCIQRISTVTRRCMTVLGDPGVTEVRWGQCRDGAPGPLPAGGAAVANLRGLAMGPTGLLVAMANCIAEVPCAVDPRVAWPGATLQAPAARTVKVNGPITIGLKLANFVEAGETYGGETGPQAMARQLALPLAMEYTLEFVNADGTLAHAVNGTATGGAVKMLQGWFTRPGKGQVLLRGLTVQGVGVFAEGGPLAFDVVN